MERQIQRERGTRRGTGRRKQGTVMGDLKTPREAEKGTGFEPVLCCFESFPRNALFPSLMTSGHIFSLTCKGQRRFGVRQPKTHVPALLTIWVILRDSLHLSEPHRPHL